MASNCFSYRYYRYKHVTWSGSINNFYLVVVWSSYSRRPGLSGRWALMCYINRFLLYFWLDLLFVLWTGYNLTAQPVSEVQCLYYEHSIYNPAVMLVGEQITSILRGRRGLKAENKETKDKTDPPFFILTSSFLFCWFSGSESNKKLHCLWDQKIKHNWYL